MAGRVGGYGGLLGALVADFLLVLARIDEYTVWKGAFCVVRCGMLWWSGGRIVYRLHCVT